MGDDRLVLVTARSFGTGRTDPQGLLERAGLRVVRGDPTHRLAALAPYLSEAVAWIAGTASIGEELLGAAPRLRLVARYGVGVDAVDLDAAQRHGVIVTNTPGANAEAVADMAIGLILAALRHLAAGDRAVRTGDWSARVGRELEACTVGIVGYGTIGRAVRRRLTVFGSPVVAHDPYLTDADVPLVGLTELAQAADVITLHAPPTPSPLVDRAFLAAVKQGAVLVNTARAALLDERAVAEALRSGRLGALATDVAGSEEGVASPLLEAPNVTLTPHVAGQTMEAVDRMGVGAAEECVRVLVEGSPPLHPVLPAEAAP